MFTKEVTTNEGYRYSVAVQFGEPEATVTPTCFDLAKPGFVDVPFAFVVKNLLTDRAAPAYSPDFYSNVDHTGHTRATLITGVTPDGKPDNTVMHGAVHDMRVEVEGRHVGGLCDPFAGAEDTRNETIAPGATRSKTGVISSVVQPVPSDLKLGFKIRNGSTDETVEIPYATFHG